MNRNIDPTQSSNSETVRLDKAQKRAFFDEAARLLPALPQELDPDTYSSHSEDRVAESYYSIDGQNISLTAFLADNNGYVEHHSVIVGISPEDADPEGSDARKYGLAKPIEGVSEGAENFSFLSGPLSEHYDEVMSLLRRLGPKDQTDPFTSHIFKSLVGD